MRDALIGLGSTYRCIGEYEKSLAILEQGAERFPTSREFPVFLAMTLYNLGQHQAAMELLLQVVANTTDDESLKKYQRAILFYADQLDKIW